MATSWKVARNRCKLAAAACFAMNIRHAASIGDNWSCASQTGPFQLWMNEFHHYGAGAGGAVEDQVEMVALSAVNVIWSRVDGKSLYIPIEKAHG